MRKSDGKIEYRSRADGGGNQIEYFRDDRSDSADFEESDTEGFEERNAGVNNNLSVINGLLQVDMTVDNRGARLNFGTGPFNSNDWNPVNQQVFTGLKFKIKSISDDDFEFQISVWLGTDSSDVFLYDNTISTEWETIEIDWSDFSGRSTSEENIPVTEIFLESDTTEDEYPNGFFLESFEVVGLLDFATQVDGEVEDTWDWEDSLEYWFDVENNISDFDDGTPENFIGDSGSGIAASDGYLNITDSNTVWGTKDVSVNIDTSIYSWVTFEFYSSIDVERIDLTNTSVFFLQDSTGWSANQWHLFSADISGDPDWTGTQTTFVINFRNSTNAASVYTLLNFTFIYDVNLGDVEDWSGSGISYIYTHPEGYLTGVQNGASFGGVLINGLTIDTSLFTNYEMRYRKIGAGGCSIFGSGVLVAFSPSDSFITITGSFEGVANWDDNNPTATIQLLCNWNEVGQIQIDYFLLLGHWEEPDSVIGLSDSSGTPVLNISTHFWADSSLGGRFEIELLDSSGEIAYLFLSENYTNLGNEWVRGKIEYNVLKSTLKVDIKWDNGTRILRKLYPLGYTAQSGRTPALFELGKAPKIFVSTYTASTSWQTLELDFIKAPFKEREWLKTSSPNNGNWTDTLFSGEVVDYVSSLESPSSSFRLAVPALDSLAGTLTIALNDSTALGIGDQFAVGFTIFSIAKSAGTATILFGATIGMNQNNTGWATPRLQIQNIDGLVERVQPSGSEFENDQYAYDPRLDFSIILRKERSIIDVNARMWLDQNNLSNYSDVIFTQNVSYGYADPTDVSNEFLLVFSAGGNFALTGPVSPPQQLNYALTDFDMIERDIFQDILGIFDPIVDPVIQAVASSGFNFDPFSALFKFLADIFKGVGDALGAVFEAIIGGLQAALILALSALGTLLEAAVNALQPFLTAISDAIDGIPALLDTIFQAIINGLETALELALGLVEIAVDLVTAAVDIVAGVIQDLIDDILDILALLGTFIVDILSAIVDWIEDALIPSLIAIMFNIWDLIWTPILNLIGLKAFVDGIVQQDFGTYVSDFVSLFEVLATNLKWLVLLLVLFMVTLPILSAKGSNGKVDGGRAVSGMINNSFRTGFTTPDTSLLGFSLGRILIPTIILVYIAMKVLIAVGTLPDFFGGLPI